MLPRVELLEARVVVPAQRAAAQLDDRCPVVGRGRPDVQALGNTATSGRGRRRSRRCGRCNHRHTRLVFGSQWRHPRVDGFDAAHGTGHVEAGRPCLRGRRQPRPHCIVGEHPLQRISQRHRVRRRHQQRILTVAQSLAHPTHVGGHHRQAQRQRLHQRHRQSLPLRGQGEHVGGGHHARGVGTNAGEDHPLGHAQLLCQRPSLGLQRPLPHGHEPHSQTPSRQQLHRRQQVRVVLLLAEVGHRAHHQLVLADAQLGPHRAALHALRAHPGDIDAVRQRLGLVHHHPAHGQPHLVGDRDDGRVATTRQPIGVAGERMVGAPQVVLG